MGNSLGVRISELLFGTHGLQHLSFDLEMTTNFARILSIFPSESIHGHLEKCAVLERRNLNISHIVHIDLSIPAYPTEPGTVQ